MITARTRTGFIPVRDTPNVRESSFQLCDIPLDSVLTIGEETFRPDTSGRVDVLLHQHRRLAGHIGLVPIVVDGDIVGEVNVVPDKMSHDAFIVLRDELQSTWRELIFAHDSASFLSAGLPPALDLLRRIETSVHDVISEPRERLEAQPAVRHLRQCRRVSELTPNLMRRSALGLPTEVRSPTRVVSGPEAALVIDTLERLRRLAASQHDHATASRISGLISTVPWARDGASSRQLTRVPWGARSDARYRRIYAVWQLLRRPELEPTIGPGELRLGVKGLPKLYEYWTFLQVLKLATQLYGAPLTDLTAVLSEPAGDHGRLLELSAGTEVEFPCGIVVAFEPTIDSSARSWRQIELVSHPDRRRFQSFATPDIVVLRTGASPEAVVIDAKYVARAFIHLAAVEIHDKYSRMRINGEPIVSSVVALHPHTDRTGHWPGYSHIGLEPGVGELHMVLPRPNQLKPTASAAPLAPPTNSDASSGITAIALQRGVDTNLARQIQALAIMAVGPTSTWTDVLNALLLNIFRGPLSYLLDEDGRITFARTGQLLHLIDDLELGLPDLPRPFIDVLQRFLSDDGRNLGIEVGGTEPNAPALFLYALTEARPLTRGGGA